MPQQQRPRSRSSRPVLLYWPNIIGYVRLMLLVGGWSAGQERPGLAAALIFVSMTLDGVDGALARWLDQTSEFGAFFDVWTDNLTRALLWSLAALPAHLSLLPVFLEMTTFLATHKGGGAAWKEGCFRDSPAWVRWLMASQFRTPQGTWLVSGLFGLPFWLFAMRVWPTFPLCSLPVGVLLAAGRLMAAAVEVWVLATYLAAMVAADTARAQAITKT